MSIWVQRDGAEGKARSVAGAGRRTSPEAVERQRVEQETCSKWITVRLVAAAEEAARSTIVGSQRLGLEINGVVSERPTK